MKKDPIVMEFLENNLFPLLVEFYHGAKAEVRNHETGEWSESSMMILTPTVDYRKIDDKPEFRFPFRIKPEHREFWVAEEECDEGNYVAYDHEPMKPGNVIKVREVIE